MLVFRTRCRPRLGAKCSREEEREAGISNLEESHPQGQIVSFPVNLGEMWQMPGLKVGGTKLLKVEMKEIWSNMTLGVGKREERRKRKL